ncbi:MAG: hypothetical protein ACFB12_07530 [Leptolyngbyaceae cyanobacterium]
MKTSWKFYGTLLLLWMTAGQAASVDRGWAIAAPSVKQSSPQASLASAAVSRLDVFVQSDPGIEIFVREVVSSGSTSSAGG